MKKMKGTLAAFIVLSGMAACSDSGTSTTTTSNTTTDSSNSSTNNAANNTTATDNGSSSTTSNTTSTANKTPLSAQDSTFVMKAAMGGMMEVQAGNIAQQNAANDRVKAFGTMMVNDHSKANSELMALASGRGMTIPQTLPADMQKHVDAMKNMKGKAFDTHYMNMMVTDHKKDVSEFEKQASSGADSELKAWASRTLPTLQMHRDSATAISKAKM